jgi:hypothetical protein
MDTLVMKSLLERITARPFFFVGLIVAIVACFVIWWFPTQDSKQVVKPAIAGSIENQNPPAAGAAITTPAPMTSAVDATLPTDPAIAAEVLDRLEDEQARLKEREKDLTRQIEMSNKLLALKEKQIESMGQLEP